jgi:hypothetical protein
MGRTEGLMVSMVGGVGWLSGGASGFVEFWASLGLGEIGGLIGVLG